MSRQFNLQPWREQRRKQEKQKFISICAVVAGICVFTVFVLQWLQQSHIESQNEAINLLNTQISSLQEAKKAVTLQQELSQKVERQIRVIEDLELQRGLSVNMLSYIASTLPEGVFLDSVGFHNNEMSISGVADNELSVAEFIRILQKFPNFIAVHLINIGQAVSNERYQVATATPVRTFSLIIHVQPILDEHKEGK